MKRVTMRASFKSRAIYRTTNGNATSAMLQARGFIDV
jgi:hypothetical protein